MHILRFFLLSVALCLFAPVAAQETIANVSTDQQDADIAVRIRDILAELGGYEDVTVIVAEGVVTFRGTATSVVEANDLSDLGNRIEGVVAVKNEVVETTDISRRLTPAMERFRARWDQFVAFLPLAMIAALAGFAIVWIGLRIARARQPWQRLAPNAFIADLYRQIVRIVFIIGAIVVALDILNATALLSTILGAAGIIGLAVGFAVRDTVENFIASVMLSIRQPFRPNDTVEINGDQGKVIRLTSRATILLSFDGNHIRIPNATVFKSRIINFSQNAERRFLFGLQIDRNADLHETRALVEKTVQNLPFVLAEPAAATWIDALAGSAIQLQITGWVNQGETSLTLAKGEAIRQVKIALQTAGVELIDSTQSIAIERTTGAPAARIAATESTEVEPVAAKSDGALDKIINAERAADDTEDLLGEEGLKE